MNHHPPAPAPGRHARDEDAVQTPIFAALRRGDRRRREPTVLPVQARNPVRGSRHASGGDTPVDPVREFHRDPLGAPVPRQALVVVPSWPAGRHRLEAASRPT